MSIPSKCCTRRSSHRTDTDAQGPNSLRIKAFGSFVCLPRRRICKGVTFLRRFAYTDDRSVMRNVLSLSGHRFGLSLSGRGPAAGRAALAVPAGLAACAGADRSRVVPASVLTGGRRYDEGCCMEESEISARHFEQAVSYHLSANGCKMRMRRRRTVWRKAVPSVFLSGKSKFANCSQLND